MSIDEENTEIGRMFKEREDTQLRIACIGNRMRRMQDQFSKAAVGIEQRHTKALPEDVQFPLWSDISTMAREEQQAEARLLELEDFSQGRNKK